MESMIRLLFVDSESLLRSSGGAHPDAPVALAALSRLETVQGGRLLLVTAAVGQTPAQAAGQAASLGFSNLLVPGMAVRLPLGGGGERSALAAALQPLLPGVQLGECAAVLRDEERVLSCRSLGIPALAPGFDKMEWRDVPLLMARLMDPSNLHNLTLALGPYVPADVEEVSVVAAESKRLTGRARRWWPAPAAGGTLPDGLRVLLPVNVTVKIEAEGARVESFSIGDPSPAEVNEAAAAAEAHFARGEVALEPDLVGPGTTHLVEHRDGVGPLLRRVRAPAG
jgi:hypothetical protein